MLGKYPETGRLPRKGGGDRQDYTVPPDMHRTGRRKMHGLQALQRQGRAVGVLESTGQKLAKGGEPGRTAEFQALWP